MRSDHGNRLRVAERSLHGLSLGDAFGERFFVNPAVAQTMVEERALPAAPWRYTDDTEMALSIVATLRARGEIDQDLLAESFARRYRQDPHRGYGAGAHEILTKIRVGVPWREASSEVFGGQGSLGNGGAMRVAPVGAYFWDDDAALVEAARRSAEVTHFHPDGQAGAIAIAAAAAWLYRTREQPFDPRAFFEFVLRLTPSGATRDGISRASGWGLEATPTSAARELGSGQRVLAMDTVPFCLWCIARHPDHFGEALWCTVSGMGDRDTTCAIVGGVVILRASDASVPQEWVRSREPLSA